MTIQKYLDACSRRAEFSEAERDIERQIYQRASRSALEADALLTQYIYIKKLRLGESVCAAEAFLELEPDDQIAALERFSEMPALEKEGFDANVVRDQIVRFGIQETLARKAAGEWQEFLDAVDAYRNAPKKDKHELHSLWLHLWDEAADAVNCALADGRDVSVDVANAIAALDPSHLEILSAALTRMCLAKMFITATRPAVVQGGKTSPPDAMDGGEQSGT